MPKASSKVHPAELSDLPSPAVSAVGLLGQEVRVLLRLAAPVVASQLGSVAMMTADTLMVGPLGAEALAAAGFGSAVQMVVLMICMGMILGTTPLVSEAAGAGDPLEARRVFAQGVWLALALSVPLTLVLAAGESLAFALEQPPTVARVAGGFLRAVAWGAPAALLFHAGRQYLEGTGRTGIPMLLTLLGLAVNVAANRVLIYGVAGYAPPLGVVGAGWATTIARSVMLLAMALYLLAHGDLSFPRVSIPRPDPVLLRRIIIIGAPIGGQLGAEIGIFTLAAVMMGWLGPVELAAHQVALNLAATTFMVALGASIAGSIRVGVQRGAGSMDGVRLAVRATYIVVLGFMAVCALVFLLFPERLIRLYTPDAAIIAVGARLLLLAAAFQLFDGAQVAGLSVLRGVQDTRIPMLVTLFGYWVVGFPAAWALGFRTPLGASGVWLGLVTALATVAVLLAFRVRRVIWRTSAREVEPVASELVAQR